MPFTPIAERQAATEFKRQEFISLSQGSHAIRIIDEDYLEVETHFVNKASLKCLGDDCPICANNRILIRENPESFRDIKGYYPKSSRYYINVFDKTPVKICPNCKAEVKQLNLPMCPSCNQSIISVTVTPLNKIKILAKGKTLFEQLVQLEAAITDDEGTRLGLTNFDIQLMVAGTGKTTTTTPIFTGKKGTKPEFAEGDKFDLTKATITLESDEIKDFLRGVGLKDIYTGRRLKDDVNATPSTVISSTLEDAADSVMKLFNQ